MKNNKAQTKVTPSLEVHYQGKVYDVSRLPVMVGQKVQFALLDSDVATVSLDGNCWLEVWEIAIDEPITTCDEVDLGICSTDLTQMEQWFLSIYRSLNDEDRNTIERLLSLMDLENSWGDGDER